MNFLGLLTGRGRGSDSPAPAAEFKDPFAPVAELLKNVRDTVTEKLKGVQYPDSAKKLAESVLKLGDAFNKLDSEGYRQTVGFIRDIRNGNLLPAHAALTSNESFGNAVREMLVVYDNMKNAGAKETPSKAAGDFNLLLRLFSTQAISVLKPENPEKTLPLNSGKYLIYLDEKSRYPRYELTVHSSTEKADLTIARNPRDTEIVKSGIKLNTRSAFILGRGLKTDVMFGIDLKGAGDITVSPSMENDWSRAGIAISIGNAQLAVFDLASRAKLTFESPTAVYNYDGSVIEKSDDGWVTVMGQTVIRNK